jgi:hypothetical protein
VANSGWLYRSGLAWLLGGGVAAGLGGIVLSETLLRPTHEVLYAGAVSMQQCFASAGREVCAFQYRLSVGNTGRERQDRVRIEWAASLPRAAVGTRVSDLIASAKGTAMPIVQHEAGERMTAFTISDLAPNTVVDIDLTCTACERADVGAFGNSRPRIEARGSVSEADPRVSTLKKGAMNLLRVLGLFR